MSLALASWCVPSEAGDWKLSFRETSDEGLIAAEDHDPEGGIIHRGFGTTGSLSGSSEVSIVLEWQPWHEEDTSLPDEEIGLRVSSVAKSTSSIHNGQTTLAGGAVSASNLWAMPTIRTAIGTVMSHSHNLVVIANPTRATRLELPARAISASAIAPISIPPGASVAQAAGYHVSLVRDYRALSLSRPGAVGDITTVNNGVAVTYGDTTYSYVEKFRTTQGIYIPRTRWNQVKIKPVFSGDWLRFAGEGGGGYNISPHVLDIIYQWDPSQPDERDASGNGEDVANYRRTMPVGGLDWVQDPDLLSGVFRWQNTNTAPTTFVITYTAQDNRDGAVATARYELTAHDPIEEVQTMTPQQIRINVPIYRPDGTLIKTGFREGGISKGSAEVTVGTSSSSGHEFSASVQVPGLKDVLGFQYTYTITNEQSIAGTATLTEDVPQGFYVYAMATHDYLRHHKLFYKYNENGRERRYERYSRLPDFGTPGVLREVPHEAIADQWNGQSVPFWSTPPLPDNRVPAFGPTTPPPHQSLYYSGVENAKRPAA